MVNVLLHDQQLIPRLRSLKHYFFLSQSAFFTHFLDTSQSELRKPARSASKDRLQSLLEVSLNIDECALGNDGDHSYRDDVKADMATSGLYENLIKINSVKGVTPGEDAAAMFKETAADEKKKSKDKDDKDKDRSKLLGAFILFENNSFIPLILLQLLMPFNSTTRSSSRSPLSSREKR